MAPCVSYKTATVASGRSAVLKKLRDYIWIIHWCSPIKPIYLTWAVVKLHSICEGLGLSVPVEGSESGKKKKDQLNRFKHSKPYGKLVLGCKQLWKKCAGSTNHIRLCPSGFSKSEKNTDVTYLQLCVLSIVLTVFSDWQVSCDSLNGGGSQQHSQMSEAHRRPRAVPHIPDPQRIKGEVLLVNTLKWSNHTQMMIKTL